MVCLSRVWWRWRSSDERASGLSKGRKEEMTQTTPETKPITALDGFILGIIFAWIIAPLVLSFITLGVPGGPASFWLERCLR